MINPVLVKIMGYETLLTPLSDFRQGLKHS